MGPPRLRQTTEWFFHRLAEQMHTAPTTYGTLVDGPASTPCVT
jgi:hypothetical protein